MPNGPNAAGPSGNEPSGWLTPQPIFEQKSSRKLGGAFGVSFGIHLAILLALILGVRHVVVQQQEENIKFNTVFLQQPGPGGGGGGSPQPAPPKKMEIPHPKPPQAVVPTPVPVPAIPPPPSLVAPVETSMAQVLQAQGSASISQAPTGGGGRGTGIGPGTGSGLGPGEGGGTGGGIYQAGNGVSDPMLVTKVDPTYTSEAMRAKLQGEVWLDAVLETNGRLSNIKVTKSLDRTYGLDQAAQDAAKKWVFLPCKKEAQPVRCAVQLVLEFRLH